MISYVQYLYKYIKTISQNPGHINAKGREKDGGEGPQKLLYWIIANPKKTG